MAIRIEYKSPSGSFWHRSNLNDTFKLDRPSYRTQSGQLFDHLVSDAASRPDYIYHYDYRIRDTEYDMIYYLVPVSVFKTLVEKYKKEHSQKIQINI